MEQTYFLGANSKDGFYSLYGGFPADKNAFLHIIKGGPGTGKSGFMRALGDAAAARGLDVQRALCSGDPDSLDGLYIPALNAAWVDGTAPHVVEPRFFGADADYVNLGSFFTTPFSQREKDQVNRLGDSYRALYREAYACLAAAAAADGLKPRGLFAACALDTVHRRVDGILDRALGRSSPGGGRSERRFLSAISCLGEYRLNGELQALCKLIYQFDDELGGAEEALRRAAEGAMRRGADVILCPSPLEPELLEAVVIPGCALGFAGGRWELDKPRRVRLDALIPAGERRARRGELREAERLAGRAAARACEKLRQAKALHDELEAVYKGHMDFPALTKFTGSEIEKLLK